MGCKFCNGKPDAPGNYSARCKNCDGKGTLSVCNQCFGHGIIPGVLDLDNYNGRDLYEVTSHKPGEKAMVVFDCSRCRKSGTCEMDKQDCIICRGEGIVHRPCTASYHLDEVSIR
jgi:DnaJ-class molecular chaperone